jgi:hypothetical protein
LATDPGAARITLRVAARLFDGERLGNLLLTGYDAPHIWTVLNLKISCDGHTSASLTYSDFPSMTAFQDGSLATSIDQTSNVIRFMKSGGRGVSRPGYGKLSPVCRIYAFPGALTRPIPSAPTKADCERAKVDGFLT